MDAVYPTRVTQLDALTLDSEVFNILKSQLLNTLDIIPPWILKQHEIKIDLFLHYILWKLSLCKFNGTFGQQLLNMKYGDDKITFNKRRLLLIFQLFNHLHNNNLLVSTSRKAKSILKTVDISMHLLQTINLLFFFMDGKYPSIINRFLGLRLSSINARPRAIGYGFMTRELIWHGFMELLTVTVSVVNYHYIKRYVSRLLWRIPKKPIIFSKLDYNQNTNCAICSNPPILPQNFGCPHVFCYYCLQTNRLVDTNYECPSCGFYNEKIKYCQL